MKKRHRPTPAEKVLLDSIRVAPRARPLLPTKRDIRGVLADFINDRVSLPGGMRITPEWIEKNHELAVKLVGSVRHDTPGPHGPQIVQR